MSGVRYSRAYQVALAAVGSLIYGLSQWAILVLLARFGGAAVVGEFTYALALSAPIFVLCGLSLRQVFVTDPDRAAKLFSYTRLRYVSALVALFVSLLIGIWDGHAGLVLAIVVLVKGVDLVGDFALAPVQSVGRTAAIGWYQIINGAVSIGAMGIAALAGAPIELALACSLLGSVVAAGFALRMSKRCLPELNGGPPQPPKYSLMRELVLVSAPLGIGVAIGSFTQSMPRFILERSAGLVELGAFSTMAYMITAGNAFVAALAQFELHRVSRIAQEDGAGAVQRYVWRLAGLWFLFGALIVVLAWFFAAWAVDLIYGPGYSDRNALVLLATSWAIGAGSWMLDSGLTALRVFRSQLWVNVAGLIAAVAGGLLLIPSWRLTGAAVVLLLCSLVVLIGRGVALWSAARAAEQLSKR